MGSTADRLCRTARRPTHYPQGIGSRRAGCSRVVSRAGHMTWRCRMPGVLAYGVECRGTFTQCRRVDLEGWGVRRDTQTYTPDEIRRVPWRCDYDPSPCPVTGVRVDELAGVLVCRTRRRVHLRPDSVGGAFLTDYLLW